MCIYIYIISSLHPQPRTISQVKLTVTNIRNMVARPVGTATAQTSGTFLVSTQLRSGWSIYPATFEAGPCTQPVFWGWSIYSTRLVHLFNQCGSAPSSPVRTATAQTPGTFLVSTQLRSGHVPWLRSRDLHPDRGVERAPNICFAEC